MWPVVANIIIAQNVILSERSNSMQAPIPLHGAIAGFQDTLPPALVNCIKWVAFVHAVALPLLWIAPILLEPVVKGEFDLIFIFTPFVGEWIRTLVEPLYQYYDTFLGVHALGFVMNATTWLGTQLLAVPAYGYVRWFAGLSVATGVMSMLPFALLLGAIVLLFVFTALLWLVLSAIGLAIFLFIFGGRRPNRPYDQRIARIIVLDDETQW
jgi:hypothetical protein